MKPPRNETAFPIEPNPSDDCAAARELLQRRMDGEAIADSEAVAAHRSNCSRCRSLETALRTLEEGLRQSPSPTPPATLVDRILEQMRFEPARRRRRRTRLAAAGLALAASVLGVVIAIDRMTPERPGTGIAARPDPKPDVREQLPPPTPLGEALEEAESAVASLTRKTASETLNLRLPRWKLPDVTDESGPLERLEPAVESIQEVRHGAVFGVAPITNTAKRAVDMFLREVTPD